MLTQTLVLSFFVFGICSSWGQDSSFESARIVSGLSDGKISPPPPPIVLPEYKVLKTKEHHSNGQKFVINQVVAPVLPFKLVIPPKPKLTAEELRRAVWEFERIKATSKPDGGFFMIGVTVYDHFASLLQFSYGGEEYEVYSNVDWNLFGHFLRFEGRGKQFTMMVFSGNVSTESLEKEIEYGYRTAMPRIPKLPTLYKEGASYTVLKGGEKNEVVMEFLEAIHDLYAEKKQVLAATYRERLKNDIIRRKLDEELRKNPPPKKNVIIHYWKRHTQKERAAK